MPSTSPARRTRMMEMRRCQERLRNAVISWDRRSHLGGFIVGCWLVFCLTACSGLSETFSEPSAFPTGASTALSSTRGTLLCSAGASALIAWGRIIGITSQTQRVEQVWCDHLMGQPTLQALVTVR